MLLIKAKISKKVIPPLYWFQIRALKTCVWVLLRRKRYLLFSSITRNQTHTLLSFPLMDSGNSGSMQASRSEPNQSDLGGLIPSSISSSSPQNQQPPFLSSLGQTHNSSSMPAPESRGLLLSQDQAQNNMARKRSRASRRTPTTVLRADTTNFRAMVQQFTGIPAPPFTSPPAPFTRGRYPPLGNSSHQTQVDEVRSELSPHFLHLSDYPVGIEARMRHVQSLLDTGSDESDNKVVQMLGICGMGGIGKTTIARAVYNLIVNQFEGSCFLENVREKSPKHVLVQIKETMLSQRVRRKKVLVVLDDVDKLEQLEATAGILDWFGFGSIIIITTRDEHLLVSHGVKKLYKVNELNDIEALELFRQQAFKNQEVDPRYTEMVERAIHYAGGLPLALQTIGSNLFGKTVDEWKSALEAYERIPNKDIQETLRVSYDGLEENEKEIFLDIACFFRGCTERYVTSMLHARGFYAEIGMMALKEKSLIKILTYDEDNVVTMHDLLQDMGKEIVRKQSTFWPEKRSRLWFHEDIIHILENNTENNIIEAIMLDMPEDKDVHWNQGVFGKMKNLRMLIIKNVRNFTSPKHLPNSLRVLEWQGYPSASLPFDFLPKNLTVLNLSHSKFEWGIPLEKSKYLMSHLIFTGCECIRQVPDVPFPNLTELCVDDCTNLIAIHDSVGFLDKLQRFSAKGCTKLRLIPRRIKLTSLEYLNLRDCSNVLIFPEILGTMEKLQFVDFEGTAIKNLPHSMQNLNGLQSLSLSRCTMLSIDALSNMVQKVPIVFPFLKKLRLDGSNLKIIPNSIEDCHSLKDLSVNYSKQLSEIRGLPQNITRMNAIKCPSLNIHAAPTNMVLKQIFQNGITIKRSFRLTGEKLPEWFHLCKRGNLVSFWFRNRIPDITMGVVARGGNREYNCYFKINNDFKINCSSFFSYSYLGKEIFIFNDLHGVFSSCPTLPLLNMWNYAEISFEQSSKSYHLGVEPLKWIGVYVNQENTSMEDIRFTSPDIRFPSPDIRFTGPDIRFTSPYKAVFDHQEMALGESSQGQGFTMMQNFQVQSRADVVMAKLDAYLDGGSSVPLSSHDKSATASPSEKAREALKMVQDFIDYDASILLHPEQCTVMKTNLDYLSTLSEDDGISEEMMTMISEASREFTHWCMDYTEATEKIESTSSELSRADKLEADLEDNKKRFRQIAALESDLLKKVAKMEESKKELEEQINAIIADIPSNQLEKKNELEEQITDIIADISAYQLEKNMVHRRKRGTFEEGKMLKTQRDESRKKKPDLQHEHGLAKETQTKITDEWSKLGEKFKKILLSYIPKELKF